LRNSSEKRLVVSSVLASVSPSELPASMTPCTVAQQRQTVDGSQWSSVEISGLCRAYCKRIVSPNELAAFTGNRGGLVSPGCCPAR
jgi:hypothetical protein